MRFLGYEVIIPTKPTAPTKPLEPSKSRKPRGTRKTSKPQNLTPQPLKTSHLTPSKPQNLKTSPPQNLKTSNYDRQEKKETQYESAVGEVHCRVANVSALPPLGEELVGTACCPIHLRRVYNQED